MVDGAAKAEPAVASQEIEALRAAVSGEVLVPGDSGYDHARQVWNAAYDRHPAVIVECSIVADVVAAIGFARAHGLRLAVRSGGHDIAGHSSVEGGLMVDLKGMKAISVDPVARTAWVQPGATTGDLIPATQQHGLILPTGDAQSVGVGGLTLGGGIGFLARKFGLTIDHLLAAEIVTADGETLTASAAEHPGLFWALRGGGGNFGIVTAYQFRLDRLDTILGGALFLPATAANLLGYVQFAASAPDDLTTIATIIHAPPAPFIPADLQGTLALAVLVCYAGDLEAGAQVVAPLRALDQPIADLIQPMPYAGLFQFTAEGDVEGRGHDSHSLFVRELDGTLANTIIERMNVLPVHSGMTQIRVLGGAMSRVPADATAFAHRDKQLLLVLAASWADASDEDAARTWTEEYWEAVEDRVAGAYVNFLGDEGDVRIHQAYPPETYARLARVKRMYDPGNFFQGNENVPPAE